MKKKLYGKYYWYREKPWWEKKVNVNKSLNETKGLQSLFVWSNTFDQMS